VGRRRRSTRRANERLLRGPAAVLRGRSVGEAPLDPRFVDGLVEIPVSLPDDLQLYDGLGLGEAGMRRVWSAILEAVHRRGELFDPLFHPETFEVCRAAFVEVLTRARELKPRVWVTVLRDIATWWTEKARFSADVADEGSALRVRLRSSDRATILVRNLPSPAPVRAWDDDYEVFEGRELVCDKDPRPLVGLSADVPDAVRELLEDQGYITDSSATAPACSAYLARRSPSSQATSSSYGMSSRHPALSSASGAGPRRPGARFASPGTSMP
jgi:hypothetical protein